MGKLFAMKATRPTFQRLQRQTFDRAIHCSQKSHGGVRIPFVEVFEAGTRVKFRLVTDKYFGRHYAAARFATPFGNFAK